MAMAFLSTQNEIIILPTSVKNGKVPITVKNPVKIDFQAPANSLYGR